MHEELIERVRPVTLTVERTIPLASWLRDLIPGGIRRGSTVVVNGRTQGVHTLAFSLASSASLAGAWCAAVGFDDLGLVAVSELGVVLERLALVPDVAPRDWVKVAGALVDSVDIILARPPAHLRLGDARRLSNRARERGAVLILVGDSSSSYGASPWGDGADLRLSVTETRWEGPGTGEGHLQRRRLEVTAGGRGVAARQRVHRVWMCGSA